LVFFIALLGIFTNAQALFQSFVVRRSVLVETLGPFCDQAFEPELTRRSEKPFSLDAPQGAG
jgi:hypothetical protein